MKKFIIIVVLIVIAGFGWWTISPLFIDREINDELPVEISRESSSQAHKIEDTAGHPATGFVRVFETDGQTTVRFEDYDGTNGPDLFIYLTKDLEANEFVSLGRSRGNMGNINYVVPDDVDVGEYKYVMTWCKAFGVLFDYAEIN